MDFVIMWKALSSYGVLGIMVVVEMFAIAKLYRDRDSERERHRAEMDAFRDRYVAKAETYMEKFAELSRGTHAVLDSLQRAARERERSRRITDADSR